MIGDAEAVRLLHSLTRRDGTIAWREDGRLPGGARPRSASQATNNSRSTVRSTKVSESGVTMRTSSAPKRTEIRLHDRGRSISHPGGRRFESG